MGTVLFVRSKDNPLINEPDTDSKIIAKAISILSNVQADNEVNANTLEEIEGFLYTVGEMQDAKGKDT